MALIEILDVGSSVVLGSRQTQEDRHAIAKLGTLTFDDSLACFAVYDGHGGPEVAEHAKTHLISTIDRRLAICDDYEQAIKDAMVEEDTTIRKTGMLQPGSTAALALVNVKEGFVVVGDLGDSHVVLAERVPDKKGIWKAKILSTTASKPWSKEERERIHDAGGKLNRVYGETRLGALNMSRSLGDMDYKQPAASWITSSTVIRDDLPKKEGSITGDLISNEAHTIKCDLTGRCLLMLATDGVGEGPSAMKYARTAAEMWDKKMSAQKIADQLTRKAEKTRFADNTTILIVCIKGSTEQ